MNPEIPSELVKDVPDLLADVEDLTAKIENELVKAKEDAQLQKTLNSNRGKTPASDRQKEVASETIQKTRPWESSTGAKTPDGKARSSMNAARNKNLLTLVVCSNEYPTRQEFEGAVIRAEEAIALLKERCTADPYFLRLSLGYRRKERNKVVTVTWILNFKRNLAQNPFDRKTFGLPPHVLELRDRLLQQMQEQKSLHTNKNRSKD